MTHTVLSLLCNASRFIFSHCPLLSIVWNFLQEVYSLKKNLNYILVDCVCVLTFIMCESQRTT